MGSVQKSLFLALLGGIVAGLILALGSLFIFDISLGALAAMLVGIVVAVSVSLFLSHRQIISPVSHALSRLAQSGAQDEESELDVDSYATLPCGESLQQIARGMNQFLACGVGVVGHSGRIAIAGAEVSYAADVLKKRIDDQVEHIQSITDSTAHISSNIQEAAANSETLKELSRQTRKASYIGQEEVQGATEQMRVTGENAQQAADMISQLEDRAGQISEITKVISGIADQTNLLALNAAIEAARAGEQGRGFAVVAEEVRNLATRTSTATTEIGQMVAQINDETGTAATSMRTLVEQVEESRARTAKVNAQLEEILQYARDVDARVVTAAERSESNQQYQSQINSSLEVFSQSLEGSSEEVDSVSRQSLDLSEMAESIFELLGDSGLRDEHQTVYQEAVGAVEAIQQCFEQAVESGTLTMDALFDRNYQPIADTNPQKFSTKFDSFTDANLPAIQEPILTRHTWVAYAGAVDDNGYFPTHNKRFAQALTGDYEKDLVNNRTKRVFNDRTGAKCASNTKPFLLQTYKRDTGEVMHDLSVPIFIKGKHWGGFRVGYQVKQH